MEQPIIITESTLTDRYQTTVPEAIRKALHLHKREKILFTIGADGKVTLSRAAEADSDSVLGDFLNFLAKDISHNPEHLQMLNQDLAMRIGSLVEGVDVDLDAPLAPEDD